MPVLFAVTLFVSASLLFMVQPMVGKMVLPLLGGSPAAWNTCMVFFQGLLLVGYGYSHHVTTRYQPVRQARIHLAVLGGAVAWMIVAAFLSVKGSPVPVFTSLAPQGTAYPMFGVMALLFAAIGFPFLVVATSAPLLQRWYSYTGEGDPYYLYASSNAGSLLSLLAYPLILEPTLTLVQQAWLWAGGFVVLMGLVYACGRAANSPLRPPERAPKGTSAKPETTSGEAPPLRLLQKLRWLGLAFVPSSLMLGVTFHMTTDIASVPLLWVIPLALYLLTFIIAYGRQPKWFRPTLVNLSPVLTLLLVFVLISNVTATFSTFFTLLLHLTVYFFTALLMHSELARARPKAEHLTEYYLWISLGGVLGGMFNALLAPIAFPLAYEYPIAIAIGCLLIPVPDAETHLNEKAATTTTPVPVAEDPTRRMYRRMFDVLVPLAMLALVSWLTILPEKTDWFVPAINWVARTINAGIQAVGLSAGVAAKTVLLLVIYALPCMLCFFFIDRPIRFGMCVAAVLGVCYYRAAQAGDSLWADRSFFGILHAEQYDHTYPLFRFEAPDPDADGKPTSYTYHYRQVFNTLHHGTTLHGRQTAESLAAPRPMTDPAYFGMTVIRPTSREWAAEAYLRDESRLLAAGTPWDVLLFQGAQVAWDARQDPLTYYHRTGPVGEIVRVFRQRFPKGHMAMIGLGTGSIAAYALPGTELTFYEIDPTVIDLVQKHDYFTYVKAAQSRGAKVNFILGDARLKLDENQDARYGLLLVDAFSSDSIPVHMLTLEAVSLYRDRLAEGGLLAIHISNRYISLGPVVARLAEKAGLVARVWSDSDRLTEDSERYPGKTESSWVVLARSERDLGDLGAITADTGFHALAGSAAWNYFDPWRHLRTDDAVDVWTDDFSDVLRVMRLKEIRWARQQLGLPVPKERDD